MEKWDLSIEIENIKKDVRMRPETDSMMSIAWIIVFILPIIAIVLWFVVIIAMMISIFISTFPPAPGEPFTFDLTPLYASIGVLYAVLILAGILFIILMYKLVKRRNRHFRRLSFLWDDTVATIKTIATKKGVDVSGDLASLEWTLRETKAEETESTKGAMLWAILSTATGGLAAFYVWYFLMKDFYKHERREDSVLADISRILDKCGIKFEVPRRTQPLPERSFVLYLILTIITLGFFGIYWLYVLLDDPNVHVRYHTTAEDQMLGALQTVPV